MAYIDLYSDAELFYSFNNTTSYVTTATLASQGGDTDPLFVTDVPAGIGATHSAHLNHSAIVNTAQLTRHNFNQFPIRATVGRTYTTWLKLKPKVTLVDSSTNLGGSSLVLYINEPSSGANDHDQLQLNLGTYKASEYGGSDRFIQSYQAEVTTTTGVSSRTSTFSTGKVPLDKWVHIAHVMYHDATNDIIERAIYVDGMAVGYYFTSVREYGNLQWEPGSGGAQYVTANTYGISSINTPNVDVYQSYTGLWNRALTREEIRQQAWVAYENQDYNSVVLADNPVYYADFDNPDYLTPHSVYGTGNWEPWTPNELKSYSYNQPAFATEKGWKHTVDTVSSNNRIEQTGINYRTGMGELLRSGEFSFEFWFKMNEKPTSTRAIFTMDPSSATLKNGYVELSMHSNGYPTGSSAYKSGATSYLTGSLSASALSIATSPFCTIHPAGTGNSMYCDGTWHHFVYTQTLDATPYTGSTGYLANSYIDGARVQARNWTSTYGWLDGVDPIAFAYMGLNSNLITYRDFEISSYAVYPTRLSKETIQAHYLAGADYSSEQGQIKYYDGNTWQTSTAQKIFNGTDWIDWDAKYYDGTNWVVV